MNFTPGKVKALIIWLAVSVIIAAVTYFKLGQKPSTFDADLLSLIEVSAHDKEINEAATKPFYHRGLILFSSPQYESTQDFLSYIKPLIEKVPLVKSVYFNPLQHLDFQSIATTYSSYPLALLSDHALAARKNNNYDYINQRYISQLSQLADPITSLTIQQAPLLNVADWLNEKQQLQNWRQQGDFIFIEDGGLRYFPLFIEFSPAATALNQAPQAVSAIQNIIQNRQSEHHVDSIYSGLIFHTAAITSRAEFEMRLFGGLSIIGIMLLTWLSFKTIRPLFNILLLIVASGSVGMAVLVTLYDEIHLITLVFSISLIGIAVDYGYHILLSARHTKKQGTALAKFIAPALMIGGGSTLLSYLLLFALPIPFLQQVSIFVGSGVIFAIFTCLTIISAWPGSIIQEEISTKVTTLPPWSFKLIVVGILLSISIALAQWHFDDNIKSFNSTPQWLLENESQAARLIGNQQYPRFISFAAPDKELLLQRFESVRESLLEMGYKNELLRGIDQWLPSARRQQTNASWLKQGLANNELDIITQYTAESTIKSLLNSPTSILRPENVPLDVLQSFPAIVQQDNQVTGILSYLGDITPQTAAQMQLHLGFPVLLLDQPKQLSNALQNLRQYILYFLLLAATAITILMIIRYGALRGLSIAMTPILASLGGLALTHLLVESVTIFNLLASMLILTLVVDYVVFCQEHGKVQHVDKAIKLSAITTALGFGMFVFSATPAIKQFGMTVLMGITLGWLMCFALPKAKNKG